MPIIRQRHVRPLQLGRIRTGEVVKGVTKDGKEYTAPKSASSFIITSIHIGALEAIARQLGGTVEPWDRKPGHYVLRTETRVLKAIVSLVATGDGETQSISRNYERWKKGYCTHRCDGTSCTKTVGKRKDIVPCECDFEDPAIHELKAKGAACKLVSRLSVILPYVSDFGVWRLDTSSDTFDMEFTNFQQWAAAIADSGTPYLPVLMTLDERERVTGPGDGDGAEKKKFQVVTVTVDPSPVPFAELISRVQHAAMGRNVSLQPEIAAVEQKPALPENTVAMAIDEQMPDMEWFESVVGTSMARDAKSAADGDGLELLDFVRTARKHHVDDPQLIMEAFEKWRTKLS